MVKYFIGLEMGKSKIDGANFIFRANISKGGN